MEARTGRTSGLGRRSGRVIGCTRHGWTGPRAANDMPQRTQCPWNNPHRPIRCGLRSCEGWEAGPADPVRAGPFPQGAGTDVGTTSAAPSVSAPFLMAMIVTPFWGT